MKTGGLGILSALGASVCCIGPASLALVGAGSVGFGAFIGRFHWWFLVGAIALLAFAWRNHIGESRRCATEACQARRGKTSRAMLIGSSSVVALFLSLNLYTYAGQNGHTGTPGVPAGDNFQSVVIPVEGMVCGSCEALVESSLERLPGVEGADASVKEGAASVTFDPARVTIDDLIVAINNAGYRAGRPDAGGP